MCCVFGVVIVEGGGGLGRGRDGQCSCGGDGISRNGRGERKRGRQWFAVVVAGMEEMNTDEKRVDGDFLEERGKGGEGGLWKMQIKGSGNRARGKGRSLAMKVGMV